MIATTQYPQEIYNTSNSKTTFAATSVPMGEVPTANVSICLVTEGFLIPIPSLSKNAKVLQTFYIQLVPVEEGYVATSPISDIYELASSVGDVVRNYLYSLVDELLWLQERKENLSAPLLKQLDKIQSYVSIL